MKENNEESPKKEKSFLETVREIDEQERLREEQEEREREERLKQREIEERRAYEEKLRQERIELIKLKQGVISEDDIPKEEKIEKEYTLREKISNFFYHNKLPLIVGTAAVLFAAFIVYDFVTREVPDVTVLYINSDRNMEFYMDSAALQFQPYCNDYNGDGKTVLKMYYVPALYEDDGTVSMQMAEAERTKLVAEFQSGEAVMILGDPEAYDSLGITEEGQLADMRELFPDDPNAEKYGYRLSGTTFAENIGYEPPADVLISLRLPRKTVGVSIQKMTNNYNNAEEVLKNYIAANRKAEDVQTDTAE